MRSDRPLDYGNVGVDNLKEKPLVFLGGMVLLFLITSFVLGVITPPNNWDGMSYHLSRVGYWLQNKSLGPYPTQDTRQLYLLPNAELLILWTISILKAEFLAFSPQWVSYSGLIVLIYLFSRFLGFRIAASLFSACMWASVTEVMFEATSVQNDLVLTFFMMASIYFFLKGFKEARKSYLLVSAIALALALGTKATVLFVLPGLIVSAVLLAWPFSVSRLKLFFSWFCFSFVFFLFLGSYIYIQNYFQYGYFLGPKIILQTHSTLSFSNALSNMIHIAKRFFDTSGVTFLKLPYFYKNVSFHEDSAGYGLVWFGFMLPAFFLCFLKKPTLLKSAMAICGFSFLLFFSACLRQDPWMFRLLIPLTALIAPFSAYFYPLNLFKKGLSLRRKIFSNYVVLFIAIASIQTATVAFCNPSKPVYVLPSLQKRKVFKNYLSIFQMNKYERRYLPFSDLKLSEMAIYEALDRVALNDERIGLIVSGTDWDYPAFGEHLRRRVLPIIYSSFDNVISHIKKAHLDYLLIFGPVQKFEGFHKELTSFITYATDKRGAMDLIIQKGDMYLFDVRRLSESQDLREETP